MQIVCDVMKISHYVKNVMKYLIKVMNVMKYLLKTVIRSNEKNFQIVLIYYLTIKFILSYYPSHLSLDAFFKL